ncbi:hypothetical protein [Streptomyces sp. NPDC055749]
MSVRDRTGNAFDALPGESGVVRAGDGQRAFKAGGVEVEAGLGNNVRVCDEFKFGVEAERQDGAGDGMGESLGRGCVAESDVAGC